MRRLIDLLLEQKTNNATLRLWRTFLNAKGGDYWLSKTNAIARAKMTKEVGLRIIDLWANEKILLTKNDYGVKYSINLKHPLTKLMIKEI